MRVVEGRGSAKEARISFWDVNEEECGDGARTARGESQVPNGGWAPPGRRGSCCYQVGGEQDDGRSLKSGSEGRHGELDEAGSKLDQDTRSEQRKGKREKLEPEGTRREENGDIIE